MGHATFDTGRNRSVQTEARSSPSGSSADTRAPWQSLYPFRSHWLEVAGHHLHYLDERPGSDSVRAERIVRAEGIVRTEEIASSQQKTLLFVHGNPTWSFHWRKLIEHFRPEFRCVAIDHLGCGLSDKPLRSWRLADRIAHLEQLIESLDLRRVTLVAQDWGGAIGLGALLNQRERFERIMLFNTGAFRPWFIPWRIRVCRTPLLGRLALQGGQLFSRAALRMTITRQTRLPHAVEAGYLAPYSGWHASRAVYDFVQDIPLGPRHPTWHTLGQIEDRLDSLTEVPSLLVWGMKDWCFNPECLERFELVWPQAQVERISDAGHWVVEDATDQVLSAATQFLHKTSDA